MEPLMKFVIFWLNPERANFQLMHYSYLKSHTLWLTPQFDLTGSLKMLLKLDFSIWDIIKNRQGEQDLFLNYI